jgi:uncharacterized Ntn-hydrolase superfamily protein
MSWSIVAHDPRSGAFAAAVTTAVVAVGASCPFLRSGVGAVSTQSLTNRYLGPAILDRLGRGLAPAAAIEEALATDAGRHMRQVHAVDRHGRAAARTGSQCVAWCGACTGVHASVAGTMLAGPAVVDATFDVLGKHGELELPERLLAALDAGQAMGGDRRGRQSAAMLLTTREDFPDLDIRVDDHREPLAELRRLLAIWRRHTLFRKMWAPTKANPSGATDLDAIERAWWEEGLDRFPRPVGRSPRRSNPME